MEKWLLLCRCPIDYFDMKPPSSNDISLLQFAREARSSLQDFIAGQPFFALVEGHVRSVEDAMKTSQGAEKKPKQKQGGCAMC